MTDLVERLRCVAAFDGYYAEALAEIERLQARDAELRYEAGMYRALYENMTTRAEAAEALLRRAEPAMLNCPPRDDIRAFIALTDDVGKPAKKKYKPIPTTICEHCGNGRTRKRDDGWYCYDCNKSIEGTDRTWV